MKYWSFKVINEDRRSKVEVEYKNERKRLTAEDISGMILIKMKNSRKLSQEIVGLNDSTVSRFKQIGNFTFDRNDITGS